MKLFTALDFDSSITGILQQLQADLQQDPDCRIRQFEDASKYHLTLNYLGKSDDVEAVKARLQGIRHKVFTLQLADVKTFSNPDAGVIWVGVRGNVEQLYGLRQQIDRAAAQLGLSSRPAEFNPHITMAYTEKELLPKQELLLRYKPEQASFEVTHFHLFAVNGKYNTACFQKLETFALHK